MSAGASFSCSKRCASRHRGLTAPENIAFKRRLEGLQALPYERHESEWMDLAKELYVDPLMVEALVEVVAEGKWKNSASPRRYLTITTRRDWCSPDQSCTDVLRTLCAH